MLIINNKALKISNRWLNPGGSPGPDPYNPLNLPPNTVRVRTSDGNVPYKADGASYDSATLVTGTTDVYDVYKSGTDFSQMFHWSRNVIEVLGANTTDIVLMSDMFSDCSSLTTLSLFDTSKVTDMGYMFQGCTALQSVPLFNTSNVTVMTGMLSSCSNLTTVPLLDTSKVTHLEYMCYYCTSVQSGALALYQQASTQAKPFLVHTQTFRACGSYTETGSAELAQIPSDWK
jgi:surface protein